MNSRRWLSFFLFLASFLLLIRILEDTNPVKANQLGASTIRRYIPQKTAKCEPLISALKEDPLWINNLYNPILFSNADIKQQTRIYMDIYTCLTERGEPYTSEEQFILNMTRLYLIFANGLGTSQERTSLTLVNLSLVDDPAINNFRKQVKLPPPPGLVFVRTYNDIATMPLPIRTIFEEHNAAGVTMFTRYIAILDDKKPTWQEQSLHKQTLPRTISHELVHAYVNTNLGIEAINLMPTWFHEGVAIYFSRSGENQAIVTPNFSLYTTSPPDYKQYDHNFKFLEAKLGQDELVRRIRQSILSKDASLLYANLGISRDEELPIAALKWQREREQFRYVAATTIMLIFAYLVFSGATSKILKLKPYRRCEVCGHLFWFWNNSDLHSFYPAQRIWIPSGNKQPNPHSIFVHLACETCTIQSDKLWQDYQNHMLNIIQTKRIKAMHTYSKWLHHAPVTSHVENSTLLNFQQALSALTKAALLSQFSTVWIKGPYLFEFNEKRFSIKTDLTDKPPQSYRHVLKKSVSHTDEIVLYLGSISRTPQGDVQVVWEFADQI